MYKFHIYSNNLMSYFLSGAIYLPLPVHPESTVGIHTSLPHCLLETVNTGNANIIQTHL